MKRDLARLAFLVLGALPLALSTGEAATCTQVIGFSQTDEWFEGGFQDIMPAGTTQLMWYSGGCIALWADPNSVAWANPTRVSACAQNSNAPDAAILSIDMTDLNGEPGYQSDVSWWVQHIQNAINAIHINLPSVRQITLMSSVGGPNQDRCPILASMPPPTPGYPYQFGTVRATYNNVYNNQAINQVVAADTTGTIHRGLVPLMPTCSYRDGYGHMLDSIVPTVAAEIGDFYAGHDPAAPVLSRPSATNITANSATITWTTNVASNGRVGYDTSTQYFTESALDANLGTTHRITLQGLSPNTPYHYYVRSNFGNPSVLSLSQDFTFTTSNGSSSETPTRPTGLRTR